MIRVVEYYNNVYDEDKRLANGCDNRHYTEREVKKRIYEDHIEMGAKVLDVCCGTGLYSKFLRDKLKCQVSCCDIVPNHVEITKSHGFDALVADARELPYENESFDIVLLNGAIYHLHAKDDKAKAIRECMRVLRSGGKIFIDYLSKYNGFIEHCLMSNDFLNTCDTNDIVSCNCKDQMFSFDNAADMIKICGDLSIDQVKVFALDGITRFIKDDVNTWDQTKTKKWVDLIYHMSEECVDISEHCMIMGYKSIE
jgi:SAM-dependent methyltransferase